VQHDDSQQQQPEEAELDASQQERATDVRDEVLHASGDDDSEQQQEVLQPPLSQPENVTVTVTVTVTV
jgi:hypothetical protein